jgi:heme exporter protein C
MWKWINSFAKPEKAYWLASVLSPWFAGIAVVSLVIGTIWGLGYAPPDYQQGDSFRIIYIHVPSAILAMGAYVAMAIAALVGVVWQWRTAFMFMIAIAPVGAVMTFISLFTGSFWGKPMWGTYWIWDARLTSQLILLFLYLGVIALYSAFDDKQQAGKASGVMAMVGVINIPIIHYSVEWWNTLHQGATITKIGKPSIASEMLWPLLICIIGFAAFIGWVTMIRFKNEIVIRDLHRPWVAKMFGIDLPQNIRRTDKRKPKGGSNRSLAGSKHRLGNKEKGGQ